MKKLFLTIAMMPFLSIAQTKIDGLGSLRIGKSYPEIAESLYVERVIFDDERYPYRDAYDSITRITFWSHDRPCPNKFRLYIKEYKISTVMAYGVELFFYHDTLYKLLIINGDHTAVEEAFKFVYGKGNVSISKPKIECKYKFTGAEYEEEGYEEKTVWRNDSIICYNQFSKFFNNECKAMQLDIFEISNSNTVKEVEKCEHSAAQLKADLESEFLKTKYKNFK